MVVCGGLLVALVSWKVGYGGYLVSVLERREVRVRKGGC